MKNWDWCRISSNSRRQVLHVTWFGTWFGNKISFAIKDSCWAAISTRTFLLVAWFDTQFGNKVAKPATPVVDHNPTFGDTHRHFAFCCWKLLDQPWTRRVATPARKTTLGLRRVRTVMIQASTTQIHASWSFFTIIMLGNKKKELYQSASTTIACTWSALSSFACDMVWHMVQ